MDFNTPQDCFLNTAKIPSEVEGRICKKEMAWKWQIGPAFPVVPLHDQLVRPLRVDIMSAVYAMDTQDPEWCWRKGGTHTKIYWMN